MISSLGVVTVLISLTAQAPSRSSSMLGGDRPPTAKARPAVEKARPAAAKAKSAVEKARPAAKEGSEKGSAEALAEYNALRAQTPHTVAGESKLAMWCEEHGLKAEAYAHYAQIVRMDPRREAAWRKLGFKKQGGRWMTDAQIAEVEAQKKAERVWLPRLKKIHKDIHGAYGTRKRDAAIAALETITDPKAIPALYHEFAGSQPDSLLLIQALERIDDPLATRTLAMLAVYGRTPEVRRRATEILRGRRSGDYLKLLVGLLKPTYKYEVKHVDGPGSPGVLLVEGEKFNVARFYAPPPPPNVMPQPGDIISYDRFGMPVITRSLGEISRSGVPGSKSLVYDVSGVARFSASEMMLEVRRESASAEAQLQGDLSQIKSINDERRHFNELVMSVATYATGKSAGDNPEDWRRAVDGKSATPTKTEKPTLTELVPLAYQPTFAEIGFMTRIVYDT